jgi:hypothetical protein
MNTQTQLIYTYFSKIIDKNGIDISVENKDLAHYLEDQFYMDINYIIEECSLNTSMDNYKSDVLHDLIYDLVTEGEIDFQAIANKLKEQQP